MTEWVALLRGVNVGGVTIRSAELRELAAELGLAGARTVLATGNLAFSAPAGHAEVKAAIEAGLRGRFGYDAWVVLVTREELEAAITAFPFDADDAQRQPWVVFCEDESTRDELMGAAAGLDGAADPIAVGPGVVYWNPVKGTTTDTAFAKILAKKTYRSRTTNRNLRTLRKITG